MVRRWAETLLHIDDTPERTAAAYALGVFFAFSPYLGLHTILGVALAFALRLNRVAVLLGVYSNVPWILMPYYTAATIFGATVTGAQLPTGFRDRLGQVTNLSIADGALFREIGSLLEPLVWPYTIGSTIGSIALAVIAYPITLAFVRTRRRHKLHH
jgi:uncharacterized protein (DUF2062 family)